MRIWDCLRSITFHWIILKEVLIWLIWFINLLINFNSNNYIWNYVYYMRDKFKYIVHVWYIKKNNKIIFIFINTY